MAREILSKRNFLDFESPDSYFYNISFLQGMAGLTPHKRLANSWDYAET
jgi:hypothetical protein